MMRKESKSEFEERLGIKNDIDLDAPIRIVNYALRLPTDDHRSLDDIPGGADAALMRPVASDLIQFFPSFPEYIDPIKKQIRGEPRKVDTTLLWSLYQASQK